MTLMSSIEKELIKVTKVKSDKYDERQDFLAAVLKAMEPSRLSGDDFDSLSDEAAAWHGKAVHAMNRKLVIPDFTDHEAEEASESEEAEEVDDEVEDDDDSDEAEADEVEAEASDDADPADEASDEASDEADEEPEAEPEVKPTKGKKIAKAAKAAKPAKAAKAEKPLKTKRDYTGLTGSKDKFGIIEGTQTSKAAAMYEKGVTAKQITETLDGRYYNVLKRLEQEGHLVERLDGGIWKLTHKDETKAGKAKAAAKPAPKPVAKPTKPAKKGK